MPDKKKVPLGRNYLELHSEKFKNFYKRRYWSVRYESYNYFYIGLFKIISLPISIWIVFEQFNYYMDFHKVMNQNNLPPGVDK